MKKVFKYTWMVAVIFVVTMLANFIIASAPSPTHGPSTSSWGDFVVSSPFGSNYVIDKPRVWIPASGGSEVTVASLVGLGAGTPVPTEVNSSEVGGFLTDADDESFSALIPVPADVDLAKDIRIRALWSNSEAAGTGSGKVVFTYEPFIVGTTAISVANDACDTDGATVTDLAANVLTWSTWSTIDGGTISLTPGDDFLIVKAAVDVTTIADMTVYGIQLEYYRKWLGGDGSY